ncbi:hypothetical protein [Candidatus Amarolinea dominans]|uniref:hypothetical protein n=1 Tax=Candidatus Amarolinea dominans TaxID=3140696 RepID=UPI00313501AD|nr:hypothetical protein [Anaerolineae bacterium]
MSVLRGQALRNDRPQPGEEVELLALSNGVAQVIASQTVLGQGRFHFGGLGPGVYQVQAGATASAAVTLDGWSSATVNLALPAPPDFRYRVTSTQATPGSPRRIIGRVFDTQGNGLNGIKVQMSWPNPDPDTQFRKPSPAASVQTLGFYEFLASAASSRSRSSRAIGKATSVRRSRQPSYRASPAIPSTGKRTFNCSRWCAARASCAGASPTRRPTASSC